MGDTQPVSYPVVEQKAPPKQNIVPTDLFSIDQPLETAPQLTQPVQPNPQTLVQQSSIDILGAYNQNRGSINMVNRKNI